MPQPKASPPRGIGILVNMLMVLAAAGWTLASWYYFWPMLKEQPNGLWIFIGVFAVGYFSIAIAGTIVGNSAKRTFVQYPAMLPFAISPLQANSATSVVTLPPLVYWLIVAVLIIGAVFIAVLAIRQVSDLVDWNKKIEFEW